jgi:predicted permease
MTNDIRYALRSLLRSPGWTAAAVLTLALGVGAATTVFSWADAVLFDPIPGTREPGRLRILYGSAPSIPTVSFSYPVYRELASRTDVFSGLLAQRAVAVALGARPGEPSQRLWGTLVSGNAFEVLGVQPRLGRFFRSEEDAGPGSPPVVVLSESLWSRAFGSDPAIVGKSVPVNGAPYTVVGVAPESFLGSLLGPRVDIWAPLAQVERLESGKKLEDRGDMWLQAIARLAPGVDDARANKVLASEAARVARESGDYQGYGFHAVRLSKSPWGGPSILRGVLLALLGLMGLVLLIACANVSALLLSRAIGRRREIAVRVALGAGRGRLLRQLLTENLLLAALGGLAAVLLTVWTSGLLMAFIPSTGRPIRLDLGVDARILAFAFVAAALSSLLFGLAPAFRGSRPTIVADLVGFGSFGSIGGTRRTGRLRRGLVVSQVALSLVLLVAAGLFLRSFAAARRLDPGFGARKVLLSAIDVFPLGYSPERGLALFEELAERARTIPGVTSAALARRAPLGFSGTSTTSFELDGYAPAPGEELMVYTNNVGPGFFSTLQIGVRGREFAAADRGDAAPVAVVNETFARKYFPNVDAIGRAITFYGEKRTIVGVARDVKHQSLVEPPPPFAFVPLAQVYRPSVMVLLKTSGDPASALPALREILAHLDPNLPIGESQTMDDRVLETLMPQRIASDLLALLGFLCVAIAAVGLYGLIAHAVAQRRREFGVRMALGASPAAIERGVLRDGLGLAAFGIAIGLAAGFALARLLAGQLPGISAADPLTYAGIAALVGAVAFLATWLPARQAARIDPMAALKAE